jgi:hypothetical protein
MLATAFQAPVEFDDLRPVRSELTVARDTHDDAKRTSALKNAADY